MSTLENDVRSLQTVCTFWCMRWEKTRSIRTSIGPPVVLSRLCGIQCVKMIVVVLESGRCCHWRSGEELASQNLLYLCGCGKYGCRSVICDTGMLPCRPVMQWRAIMPCDSQHDCCADVSTCVMLPWAQGNDGRNASHIIQG